MAIRSTRDKRYRQFAEAVAAGESRFAAGARLGLDRSTIKAWWASSEFKALVRSLRSERTASAALEARAALDRGDTAAALRACRLTRLDRIGRDGDPTGTSQSAQPPVQQVT